MRSRAGGRGTTSGRVCDGGITRPLPFEFSSFFRGRRRCELTTTSFTSVTWGNARCGGGGTCTRFLVLCELLFPLVLDPLHVRVLEDCLFAPAIGPTSRARPNPLRREGLHHRRSSMDVHCRCRRPPSARRAREAPVSCARALSTAPLDVFGGLVRTPRCMRGTTMER